MKPLKLNINLLSKKELEERALNKFLKWSLTFGRYIIVGTEIIVLLAFFSRFKLDRDLTDLHQQVSQKQAIVQYNLEFEKKIRNLQKQLEEIKLIEEKDKLSLTLLRFFEENIPQEVTLNELSFNDNKVSFSGTSLSTSSFIDFLARIRTSNQFSDVTLEDLNKERGDFLKFKLKANFNET